MNALEKALKIALKAHNGQQDKAGQPYILHPLRVMHQVNSLPAKVVALLHDVVEDSEFTFEDLDRAGFDPEILQAVRCLTKHPDEDYFAYLRRIAGNTLALQVKIADLKDNLDVTRLPEIELRDVERLNRYLKALSFLQQNSR